MDEVALVTTLCTWLDAAGVGTWRPAGPAYARDEVGVFYGALDAAPDRAVGVTVYATDDDVAVGTARRWVQVRYRGAPGRPHGADELAAAGFRALHGVHHRDRIARARRVSSAHLDADDNGRQERTDNYEITLNAAPGGTP